MCCALYIAMLWVSPTLSLHRNCFWLSWRINTTWSCYNSWYSSYNFKDGIILGELDDWEQLVWLQYLLLIRIRGINWFYRVYISLEFIWSYRVYMTYIICCNYLNLCYIWPSTLNKSLTYHAHMPWVNKHECIYWSSK